MGESSREIKSHPITVEGLEDVFEADSEPIEHGVNTPLAQFDHPAKQGINHGAGMSLKAASIHYRMAPSTLRQKIKRGEIPARKVQGSNGPEWRVFATGINFEDPIKQGARHPAEHRADTAQPGYQHAGQYGEKDLLELIEKQATKLEAAAGQIGYFKAQLDSYQDQIKLLPDLQIQATRMTELERELTAIKSHWWYRFWSRFTGR